MLNGLLGKQHLHFLHIGKTGGNAVKHAIKQHLSTNGYAIYLHPHSTRLMDVPEGEKVFFFLRDPVSRFVSGFYSRKRQGKPLNFRPWSEGERSAFARFDTPNQLALALSSSDADEQERARIAMRNIGHVQTSYWHWFGDEAYFKSRFRDIIFIGFQDRLAQDFELLKAKIGLPDSAQLPDNEVQAHRNPVQVDKSLDAEAVDNLRRWYEADYRFVALCRRFMEGDGHSSR